MLGWIGEHGKGCTECVAKEVLIWEETSPCSALGKHERKCSVVKWGRDLMPNLGIEMELGLGSALFPGAGKDITVGVGKCPKLKLKIKPKF